MTEPCVVVCVTVLVILLIVSFIMGGYNMDETTKIHERIKRLEDYVETYKQENILKEKDKTIEELKEKLDEKR